MNNDFSPDDSRQRILARIAASLGRDSAAASSAAPAAYAALPRDYRTVASREGSLRTLFADRLHEYNAGFASVATVGELPEAIAAALSARGKSSLAVVSGMPPEWLPAGFDFPLADSLTAEELDQQPGILTACAVAIAETGSLVLQSGPRQGLRRHTLVPDYHLCVVFEDQLVASVPDAFARLDPELPTTFVSGPSATADIEMTRIRGVHGPRTLDVLLVAR